MLSGDRVEHLLVGHQFINALQDEVDVLHIHGRIQERADTRISQLLPQPLTTILRLYRRARIQKSGSLRANDPASELLQVVPDEWLAEPHYRRRDTDDLKVYRDEPDGAWTQVQSTQESRVIEEDAEHRVPEREQEQESELPPEGQVSECLVRSFAEQDEK